ncbi:MAG: hypothetical protein SGPRY_013223, partial [Prymnesium sp.]
MELIPVRRLKRACALLVPQRMSEHAERPCYAGNRRLSSPPCARLQSSAASTSSRTCDSTCTNGRALRGADDQASSTTARSRRLPMRVPGRIEYVEGEEGAQPRGARCEQASCAAVPGQRGGEPHQLGEDLDASGSCTSERDLLRCVRRRYLTCLRPQLQGAVLPASIGREAELSPLEQEENKRKHKELAGNEDK